MIDTDKYEGHQYERMQIDRWHLPDTPEEVIIANANLMNDAPLLLAEVQRLREENEMLRKVDWEYECLWTWLAENTNLLNTIEPLVEEWKKEMIE